MPKNLIATDLAVEALRIQTDEAGAVTALTATVNVAYSDTRAREEFDLWPVLTATQRSNFQKIHDVLSQSLQDTYLA